MMSSPFRSQESEDSSYKHRNGPDDIENREGNTFSQPFFTQVSQPPIPKHKRRPLHSKQPRVLQDTNSIQELNIHDASSLLLAPTKSVQLPTESDEHLVDTIELTDQLDVGLQISDDVQRAKVFSGIPEDLAGLSSRSIAPVVKADLWPGGRSPLVNGRHLPRYITKICKAQQEILGAPLAWQPSKADRQIRGSVPNQVLIDFTELADKTAEKARQAETIKTEHLPAIDTCNEYSRAPQEIEKDISDEASEGSGTQPSETPPWPPTPRSSAAPEPVLPNDSSPLHAPQKRLNPSVQSENSPIASVDPKSPLQYREEERLSSPFPGHQTLCQVGKDMEAADASPFVPLRTPSVKTASVIVSSGEEGTDPSKGPSPESVMPSDERQGQSENAELLELGSGQPQSEIASQRRDSVPLATQCQQHSSHQGADRKALVQVQRTPFVQQHSTLANEPEPDCYQAIPHFTTTTEVLPLDDREPKSSTSVVPGTSTIVYADQRGQSELLSQCSPHQEPDLTEDEPMEDQSKSKVVDILKSAEAVCVPPEIHCSSKSCELSESGERESQLRLGKRKYRSEDHMTPRQRNGCKESQCSCSGQRSPKRSRTIPSFPSLDDLKDVHSAKAPSQIARESRRAFFRNQQKAEKRSPSMSVPAIPINEMHRVENCTSPLPTSRHASREMQQCYATPRTSLLSGAGAKVTGGVDEPSGLFLTKQSLYNAYKCTYPEYEGDATQFYKACRQISIMRREGKALHPSLWDDFIFRRHHDYRDYLVQVAEACEDALPYLQYYTEHVEKPSRMGLVVRSSNISSLGIDSALGSRVKSPLLTVQDHIDTTVDPKTSVAVSSSASNILPPHATVSPHAPSRDLSSRHREFDLGSEKHDALEQTQESSVKQWVALQSIEKVLGAESPELGSADLTTDADDISQQDLHDARENLPPSSSAVPPPLKEKEVIWCDDPNTPFKGFARSFAALSSEQRHVKWPVKVDEKGCLQPHLQSVIDIFTLYRQR